MERENGRGSRDATRDHRPAGPGAHLHSVAPTPTSLKGASGCCLLWAGRRQFGSNGSHPRPENPSSELGGVVISPPRSGQNPPWNGRGMAVEWPWNGHGMDGGGFQNVSPPGKTRVGQPTQKNLLSGSLLIDCQSVAPCGRVSQHVANIPGSSPFFSSSFSSLSLSCLFLPFSLSSPFPYFSSLPLPFLFLPCFLSFFFLPGFLSAHSATRNHLQTHRFTR